jgi:hypothetical protein
VALNLNGLERARLPEPVAVVEDPLQGRICQVPGAHEHAALLGFVGLVAPTHDVGVIAAQAAAPANFNP